VISPETIGPFSRPVLVNRLPAEGSQIEVKANEEECVALAADFGLPELKSLSGNYRLKGGAGGVRVTGRITADLVQICVVTLEPFESRLEEDVEVDFQEIDPADRPKIEAGAEVEITEDAPDEIIDGRIDLGSLTAEFLAISLDPYPKKPGVSFEFEDKGAELSPFAGLAGLKRGDG
jgi:hypothetical protein